MRGNLVKATSLNTAFHLLLSCTIILPFQSTLFSHSPYIPFVAFLSTSHLLHQIPLSQTKSSPYFPYFQTTSTHTALFDQPTLIASVLLHMNSFLTRSIRFTPDILLRHRISIYFCYCCIWQ